MQKGLKRRFSIAWTAASWVILIAALAIVGLFELRRWHRQAAHQAAAHVVAERGQWLAMSLALRAASAADAQNPEAWREFSSLLRSLREVEDELEYVAVRRGEATLFQEHVADSEGPAGGENYHFSSPASIRRHMLASANGMIPVVTFSVGVTNLQAEEVTLELGLRRRAVEREGWPAARAIDSLYHLSLILLGTAFAVCVGLVVWVVRREEHRARARRREEHLAFSGMLANGIVHDFRNPMSSLRLDAQMLEKETARGPEARPERMASLASRMRNTLDRMEKVFQEFLTLARPDSATPEKLDLGAVARECVEMLTPRLEASGIRAEIQAGDAPAWVRVSSAALKRSVLNVLLNAIQHAGADGRVWIQVSETPTRMRLDIADSGAGIPRADRERVFEMFYTTRPKGTGLGLFLARTAIEQNGGTVSVVESGEETGARVRFEFPRVT